MNMDIAGIDRIEAGNGAEKCGFSTSGRADETDEAASLYIEGYSTENLKAPISFAQI
jgi:hypothetical protein